MQHLRLMASLLFLLTVVTPLPLMAASAAPAIDEELRGVTPAAPSQPCTWSM